MAGELRGKTAIVGVGETGYSRSSGRSELMLSLQAISAALDDCGLEAKDVDGILRWSVDTSSEQEVASSLGVELSVMKGPSRARQVSQARAVTGYVGREIGRIALSRTVEYFARAGSTLVRNVAGLEQELANSPPLRKRVASITSQLASE